MWNVTSACHFHTGEQLTPSSEVGRRQAGGQAAGGTALCRGIHRPGDPQALVAKVDLQVYTCVFLPSPFLYL